jgi:hypothetical protein
MTAELQDPIFTDENAAREAVRWPNGPICPHCGSVERIVLIGGEKRSPRPGLLRPMSAARPATGGPFRENAAQTRCIRVGRADVRGRRAARCLAASLSSSGVQNGFTHANSSSWGSSGMMTSTFRAAKLRQPREEPRGQSGQVGPASSHLSPRILSSFLGQKASITIRMWRRTAAAVTVISIVNAIYPAHAETGYEFYQNCLKGNKSQDFHEISCIRYIKGVWDGLILAGYPYICLNGSVQIGQLELIFINWARNNPNNLGMDVQFGVATAFAKAFPCQK